MNTSLECVCYLSYYLQNISKVLWTRSIIFSKYLKNILAKYLKSISIMLSHQESANQSHSLVKIPGTVVPMGAYCFTMDIIMYVHGFYGS